MGNSKTDNLMHSQPLPRVGHGFDVHPFCDGNSVYLGGVLIPFERGLKGHSDADVVLHALIDSLLGAVGWDDIGAHFPDTDMKYRGIRSTEMLSQIWKKIELAGWKFGNCDIVVLAERPKIRPHVPEMRKVISEILAATPEQIGIKATTMEKLGFVGREEGIVASATCLLYNSKNQLEVP